MKMGKRDMLTSNEKVGEEEPLILFPLQRTWHRFFSPNDPFDKKKFAFIQVYKSHKRKSLNRQIVNVLVGYLSELSLTFT